MEGEDMTPQEKAAAEKWVDARAMDEPRPQWLVDVLKLAFLAGVAWQKKHAVVAANSVVLRDVLDKAEARRK